MNGYDETKAEIVNRGQEVITNIKLKQLATIVDLVKEEIDEACGFTYYIVVDGLDDDWADEEVKTKMIYALIETLRDFRNINNLKIIVCVRTDLIERVLKQVRGAGYQEEKIRSLMLHLNWSDAELITMLDKRINKLVKDSYTTATITHKDLLPEMKKSESCIEYMLKRTWNRPRDIIQFFNYCIEQAFDRPNITKAMLIKAEEKYSDDRLLSLEQEWKAEYPELNEVFDLFKKFPEQFLLSDLTDDLLIEFAAKFKKKHKNPVGKLANLIFAYYETADGEWFRVNLASTLYAIGFLGIKTDTYRTIQWAVPASKAITQHELNGTMQCVVHKMYWRALGITSRRAKDEQDSD